MSDEEKKIEETTEVEEIEKTSPNVEVENEEKVEEVKEEVETENAETVEEIPAKELPNRELRTGMVIRVHERIKDFTSKGEERERVQVFEGVVLGLKGKGIGRTMTVRKDSKGFMVEKIFPLSSPNIVKVEIKKQYRVRRAKLSYLRGSFKRKLKELKTEK
ncbi:50S ribosomal protein L19 [Patescibacteria group bacterium]|nr:50S ribosomal protein L19 [Patescibacteria group bacterium]MBU4453250.1 50S ribosomal protein L19 [Patescibacteria group bacterium]